MTNCLACVSKLACNCQINLSKVLKAYLHKSMQGERGEKILEGESRTLYLHKAHCSSNYLFMEPVVALGTSKYKQQESQIHRQCNWRLSGSSMVASGAEFALQEALSQ